MVNSEGSADQNVQAMNVEQAKLYERIQAFSLNQPEAPLSFSQRLARENGWSLHYALQAIEEYKKFTFLAVASGHPATPSDPVDQVWHLHLSYTRSYWQEFCPKVLQTPLHHDPTQGGAAENQKFDDWYSKTLESYERFFGAKPPAEFWSTPKERFGRDLHFVRVNTQQNWILQKTQFHRTTTVGFASVAALIMSGCHVRGFASEIDPLGAVLLAGLGVGAGYGLISFLVGVVASLRRPRTFRAYGPGYGNGDASDGCGGRGGWNWQDFSGHHSDSSGDDSGCGDSGGSDGGGCSGCGGGGE
ncbi:hypothetical protein H6F90_16485 [Trichocoleus sp. FACHB-591]|uniref:glycine-rich domain-containing protein n=1 Tax=Trichocoleus sp. FACHB-591 TaxID=2692872 RepID=UPI001683F03B|nr:hypothetical protein [Trichocoleus sp. FACHB-591]MBD2096729.1 hypothetical protein [Trichocoleus sp. FACHB-591]